MEVGSITKVVQDFMTVSEGELSLQKGDVVQVLERIDRIWCLGCCAGKLGRVPSNNLMVIDIPPIAVDQELFVAIADFPGQEAGDLMFLKGDLIVGLRELDSNWWEGEVEGRTGIFPTSYTWKLDSSTLKSVSSGPKTMRLFAKVKMAMKAQLEEEMDLIPGETVMIVEQIDKDWYRGESGNRRGIFPASYVHIDDDSTSKPDGHLPSYFDVVSQDTNYSSKWSASVSQPSQQLNLISPSPSTSTSSNMTSQAKADVRQPGVDLMTFSPEKDKYSAPKPTSSFKELASELDFLNDDYFKQNMPNLFTSNTIVSQASNNKTAIQHVTLHSAEFDVKPYGITLYPFYAQFDNELSFNEGEIIHLLHHIDNDWIKGEIDGKEGIFPSSYLNIVIDCEFVTSQSRDTNVTQPTFQDTPNIEPNSFAKVLFNFDAQMNGDVSVKENELVFILATENEDWYRVKKQNGTEGLCPKNYLTHFSVTQDRNSSVGTPRLGTGSNMRSQSFSGQHSLHHSTPLQYISKPPEPSSGDTIGNLMLKNVENINYTTPNSRRDFSKLPQLPTISSSLDLPESLPKVTPRPMSMQVTRRPSPPSSPPPQPPSEDEQVSDAVAESPSQKRRSAPPVPVKPIGLNLKTSASPSVGTFQRTGSDRTPHRPAPPVPMPGQVPVRRTMPRPAPFARHLSAPAGSTMPEQDENNLPAESSEKQVVENTTSTEDIKKRNREQRQNVISELASTEKEYIRDLKITYETFNLYNPEHLEARGIDPFVLFGNILEVIQTAENLLDKILLAMKGKEEEDQVIAPSFLEMADELQTVYSQYCMNHEDALALLEKYESNQEAQKLFQKGLETLRYQIACFDMSSILIKPVQRIMKYPLILNELFKCTEDEHKDKADLSTAVKTMSEVASYINECKRRKDIVSKYLEDGNTTLSTRMSRISLHSVAKMSTRLGAKLSSTLGIGTVIKDQVFEEHEKMFRTLEKSMRTFLKNVETFVINLQDVVHTQFQCAEAIADFYHDMKDTANVDEFRTVQHSLISEVFSGFKSSVETRVIIPLTSVLALSEGPSRLVLKRSDKLLDYESWISKADKSKDARTQDELNLAKNTYEALNTQLLEELPKFTTNAGEIYVDCITAFISARKLFSAKVTKQYLSLMELPLMVGCTGDILEIFKVKHNITANDIGTFSFASKYFKQDNINKRSSKISANLSVPETRGSGAQSPSQKAFLQSKYPHDKLHVVRESYTSSEILELSVCEGHLVAVIKKQDPMGNSERWYVDDGENQGFLPSRCLTLCYGVTPPASPQLSLEGTPTPGNKTQKQLSPRMSQSPRSVSPASTTGSDRPPPSYEEVVNYSPQSFVSTEDSAIYEEIPSPSSDQQNLYEEIPELEFFYASYDFTSLGEHMISLKKGQVVKVLHKHDVQRNSEWWFVEDRSGVQGYVPGNYLAKYD